MPLFGFRGLAGLQEGDLGVGRGWRSETWPLHAALLTSYIFTERIKSHVACGSIQDSCSHICKHIKKKHIHIVSSMCFSDASCGCRNVSISSGYDRWADSGRGHLCLQSVVWVNCSKIWQACCTIFLHLSFFFCLLWSTCLNPVISVALDNMQIKLQLQYIIISSVLTICNVLFLFKWNLFFQPWWPACAKFFFFFFYLFQTNHHFGLKTERQRLEVDQTILPHSTFRCCSPSSSAADVNWFHELTTCWIICPVAI